MPGRVFPKRSLIRVAVTALTLALVWPKVPTCRWWNLAGEPKPFEWAKVVEVIERLRYRAFWHWTMSYVTLNDDTIDFDDLVTIGDWTRFINHIGTSNKNPWYKNVSKTFRPLWRPFYLLWSNDKTGSVALKDQATFSDSQWRRAVSCTADSKQTRGVRQTIRRSIKPNRNDEMTFTPYLNGSFRWPRDFDTRSKVTDTKRVLKYQFFWVFLKRFEQQFLIYADVFLVENWFNCYIRPHSLFNFELFSTNASYIFYVTVVVEAQSWISWGL